MNNFVVAIYHFRGPVISNESHSPLQSATDENTDFFTTKNESVSYFQTENGGLWVVAILGPKGNIEHEAVWDLYDELFPHRKQREKHIGPFESVEEIEMLMIALCDKLQFKRAALCSAIEYNMIIEDLNTLEINNPSVPNLAQLLLEKTKEIKLPESSASHSFFGKIFH